MKIVLPILFFGVALILLLLPLASAVGLVDRPDERKKHKNEVPMVGGIAIYIMLLTTSFIFGMPDKLFWFLSGAAIIVVVGVLDDLFGLSVSLRLSCQVCATIVVIWGSNLWISFLNLPMLGLTEIPVVIGLAATILGVVGLTNCFNLVDGLDGLAAGHALVSLGTLACALLALHGEIHQAPAFFVLIAAIFAFWLVNMSVMPIRKVFLGDAGSLLLGFTVAWVSIYYTQPPIKLLSPIVALWIAAMPVLDTLFVVVQRLKRKKSPFVADRGHLHHILIDRGYSDRVVLVVIIGFSILVNLCGIFLAFLISSTASLILFLFLSTGYLVALDRLSKKNEPF